MGFGLPALTFVTDKVVAIADGAAKTTFTFSNGLQFGEQNDFSYECNADSYCAAYLNGVRNTEGASRFNGHKCFGYPCPSAGLMDEIGGSSNSTMWTQIATTPHEQIVNWAEGVKISAARIVTDNLLYVGSGTGASFPTYINGANANSRSVLTTLANVTGTQLLMSVGSGGITDSISAGRTFTLGQSTPGNVTVLLPPTDQTVSFTSSAPSNLVLGSTYTPTTSSTNQHPNQPSNRATNPPTNQPTSQPPDRKSTRLNSSHRL